MIQPILINLRPREYSQEFHYIPSAVKLDRCLGSSNTFSDLFNKVCVPNKTEDLHLSAVQHNYRNKRIVNVNKAHNMQM